MPWSSQRLSWPPHEVVAAERSLAVPRLHRGRSNKPGIAVTLVPAPGAAASASPSASMCFWMGSLRFLASTSHPSLQWFLFCLAAQDEGVEAEDTYSRGTGNCRISTHSARKSKITREPLQLVHDNCHGEEWDSRPGWSNDQ